MRQIAIHLLLKITIVLIILAKSSFIKKIALLAGLVKMRLPLNWHMGMSLVSNATLLER